MIHTKAGSLLLICCEWGLTLQHVGVRWEICERVRKQEMSGLNRTGCVGQQEKEGGVIMHGIILGRVVVSGRQSVFYSMK